MSSLLWTILEVSVNFFEAFIYLYFFKNRINICKKSIAAILYVLFLTQLFFHCTCSLTSHFQTVSEG